MAQKTVVTPYGEKIVINTGANNGLTANGGNIQLGGPLTKATVLTTTDTSTLAIQGLQAGTNSDNVVVTDANGVLKSVSGTNFGGNDNLGNHIATKNLMMSGKDVVFEDRSSNYVNYFSLYKAYGYFSIWNNQTNSNALSIDENNNKTTLMNAQIIKGTDGNPPAPGAIATAADANGNIVWTLPAKVAGAISGVHEFLGTNQISVNAGSTTNVPMNKTQITLNSPSVLLITYSVLPLPTTANNPTQGSINLIVDGVKQISSYYSAWDAPSVLVRLGNYSTAQKVIELPAGTHTISLSVKSWAGSVLVNTNPTANGYVGSLPDDAMAMSSRISIVVFNK
jgi:hypothetical protein